jgi:hypothetical protein
MPTPFEVTQMLQNSGTAYNVSLTNPISNSDKYISEKAQALNLGVYGADLAYAVTYNQTQSAREFINASKKLSDELEITNVISKSVINRIENNSQNADSLYKIINHTYLATYNKLNELSKKTTALTIIAGAWIESLYLATQLAIVSQNNSELIQKIAEQKFNFNTLLNLLKQSDSDSYISDILGYINQLKPIFDNVKADDDGKVKMSEKDFDNLTNIVKKIRTQIISLH